MDPQETSSGSTHPEIDEQPRQFSSIKASIDRIAARSGIELEAVSFIRGDDQSACSIQVSHQLATGNGMLDAAYRSEIRPGTVFEQIRGEGLSADPWATNALVEQIFCPLLPWSVLDLSC